MVSHHFIPSNGHNLGPFWTHPRLRCFESFNEGWLGPRHEFFIISQGSFDLFSNVRTHGARGLTILFFVSEKSSSHNAGFMCALDQSLPPQKFVENEYSWCMIKVLHLRASLGFLRYDYDEIAQERESWSAICRGSFHNKLHDGATGSKATVLLARLECVCWTPACTLPIDANSAVSIWFNECCGDTFLELKMLQRLWRAKSCCCSHICGTTPCPCAYKVPGSCLTCSRRSRLSEFIGLIIHVNGIFPYKPSSYGGTPILGNLQLRRQSASKIPWLRVPMNFFWRWRQLALNMFMPPVPQEKKVEGKGNVSRNSMLPATNHRSNPSKA